MTVEESCEADYGIEPQQRERDARVVQVNAAASQLLDKRLGERVEVNLESDRERSLGAYSWSDAAKLAPLDGLVKPERVSPE